MNRRQLLSGLIAVTAPAIVPFKSLMPLRGYVMTGSLPYGLQKGAVYYVVQSETEIEFQISTDAPAININPANITMASGYPWKTGDRIMFMSDQLGMRLSKLLFEEEPELLVCDLEASARASAAVANLLGCILSTVLVKMGPEDYCKIFEKVCHKVNDSAMETAKKSMRIDANKTSH
jgi:hypothetical protein